MVEDLPLKIRKVYDITINQANGTNASRPQVIGDRAAQAACTHNKEFGLR
jgi:hypothetical protein